MANPSESELQTQIGNGIWILENLRTSSSTVTDNFLDNYDAFTESMKGSRAPLALQGADSIRTTLNSLFTPAVGTAMLDPLWLTYGLIEGFQETSASAIIVRLQEDFSDNSKTVNSSEFTFGTVTDVGTPVGSGTINRLTKDQYGFDIESQLPEVKTFRCIRDEHSGASEQEEVFSAFGEPAERDLILLNGSGKSVEISGISARTSLLRNSSFDQFTGSASSSPTIPGWTISVAANVQSDSAEFYRGAPNVTSPLSLQLDDNVSVTQKFSVGSLTLDPETPYYCQVAYNREVDSGDGTLTLSMGSSTASVVLSAQTGWNILRIAIGTGSWFQNFNEEDASIDITLSGRTTGTTLIDDVVFAPFQSMDNTWWLPVGGTTPWLLDDEYTFTDTAVDAGVIQRWLRREYGLYLPSDAGGSETWPDPS